MNKTKINREVIPRLLLAAIFYFILYSFLGWVVDSVYNSIMNLSWSPGGFFKSFSVPVPLAPIYGFAAATLIFLKYLFGNRHQLTLFFLCGIFATAIEYWGGVWMVKVIGHRAWDYSDQLINLNGHIALKQTIYWFILGWIFINYIHPPFRRLFNRMIK